MKLAPLAALVLCVLSWGRASHAVTHGTETTLDPAVVAIGVRDPCVEDAPTIVCTGTLIAARVVLTAAHCLNVPLDQVRVYSGADLAQAGAGIRATSVRPHRGFDAKTYANDIGLVVLAEAASAAPAAMRRAALEASVVGARVRVVGYGIGSDEGRPGIKRTGTATVTGLGVAAFRIGPGPSMTCQLDSGGPVLLESGGTEVVAGVTSNGDRHCAEWGDNTRVDVFVDSFVQPVIDAVSANPESPPPLRECPTVTDCTRDGCPGGRSCDRVTGQCVGGIAAKAGGGCGVAPSGGVPWWWLLAAVVGAAVATRRSRAAIAVVLVVAVAVLVVWLAAGSKERRAAAPSATSSATPSAPSGDAPSAPASAAPSEAQSGEVKPAANAHARAHERDASTAHRDNIPSDDKVLVMLDEVIARVRKDLEAESDAGSAARVKQLQVRLERLTRERDARADGGAMGRMGTSN